MTRRTVLDLSVTTQGPTYPPSEVMDADGNFIVIGRINRAGPDGTTTSNWGRAIVAPNSPLPPFGGQLPYRIVRELGPELSPADEMLVLHTLPLPLPCHNYPMVFAPDQLPDPERIVRPSHPFHQVPIPDMRPEDGRATVEPVTLGAWVRARGQVRATVAPDARTARFELEFEGLIPNSLYTVMSLRQRDLDPAGPTRPGPLGIPNALTTDHRGRGRHEAVLPDPFPQVDRPSSQRRLSSQRPCANRIVNVVLLWMSYQRSHGGAIGLFGLGGDIHAQLKLERPSFLELETRS